MNTLITGSKFLYDMARIRIKRLEFDLSHPKRAFCQTELHPKQLIRHRGIEPRLADRKSAVLTTRRMAHFP